MAWPSSRRPKEPFKVVSLDRVKVGFGERELRTGPGQLQSFAEPEKAYQDDRCSSVICRWRTTVRFTSAPPLNVVKTVSCKNDRPRRTPVLAGVFAFGFWLPDFGNPPAPYFHPFFAFFSLSSLFLPDDQVAKSERHIPLYTKT